MMGHSRSLQRHECMYRFLGEFSSRYRWQIIAGWLLATLALRLLAPDWSAVALDGDFDQLPPTTPTARAVRLNAAAFPHDATKSQLVLVFAREGEELTARAMKDKGVANGRSEGVPAKSSTKKRAAKKAAVVKEKKTSLQGAVKAAAAKKAAKAKSPRRPKPR